MQKIILSLKSWLLKSQCTDDKKVSNIIINILEIMLYNKINNILHFYKYFLQIKIYMRKKNCFFNVP